MVVLLTKCESRWHPPLYRFLEKAYGEVFTVFLNDEIKTRKLASSGRKLIDGLYSKINNLAPSIVIFDLEFSLLLSPDEVSDLSKSLSCPVFGIAMDDDRFHDINRQIYAGLDGILTHPLSVERYRLIGYKAFDFFPSWELCRNIEQDKKIDANQKDIDVLSYGLLKGDRKWVLEQLKEKGINVYHPPFDTSDDDLDNLIRRSKIVINLSSGSPVTNSAIQFLPFSNYKQSNFPTRQLKSRIYEVAALGTLCVSETFAGDGLVLSDDAFIKAKDPSMMVEIINKLISDNKFYETSSSKFLSAFHSRYNLDRRIDEFKVFADNVPLKRIHEIEIGIIINACCLAAKCIYSLNPMTFFTFRMNNSSWLKSIFVRLLSLVFVLYSFWCALLKRS